jgi:hypothetical protein
LAKGLLVPPITLGNEQWFSLSYFGVKHVIRFLHGSMPRDVPDPSGHRLREMVIDTQVKWRPRDTSRVVITDVSPLGARKK